MINRGAIYGLENYLERRKFGDENQSSAWDYFIQDATRILRKMLSE